MAGRKNLSPDQVRLMAEVGDDVSQASDDALQKMLPCAQAAKAAYTELDSALRPILTSELWQKLTQLSSKDEFNLALVLAADTSAPEWQLKQFKEGVELISDLFTTPRVTTAPGAQIPHVKAGPATTAPVAITAEDVEQISEFIENPAGDDKQVLTDLAVIKKATWLKNTVEASRKASEGPLRWWPYTVGVSGIEAGEQMASFAGEQGWGSALEECTDRPECAPAQAKYTTGPPGNLPGLSDEELAKYPPGKLPQADRLSNVETNKWVADEIVYAGMEALVAATPDIRRLLILIKEKSDCIVEAGKEFVEKQHKRVQELVDALGGELAGCAETGTETAATTTEQPIKQFLAGALGAHAIFGLGAAQGTKSAKGASKGCKGLQALDFPELTPSAIEKALAAIRNARRPLTLSYSQNKERMLFQEQCYLLSYVGQLAKWKKENLDSPGAPKKGAPQGGQKRLPYKTTETNPDKREANATLLVDGDPFGFLNRLTLDSKMKAFFDISTSELSHLQPMIRLYKINRNEDGTEWQQEIKFESNAGSLWPTKLEDALHKKAKRGFGVGVKDFSFTYEGSNPFAIKKSIKGKLKIFANSFDELLLDRGGWRYADLALKTGGSQKKACSDSKQAQEVYKENEENSKLNFRLKAVVGWAEPKGASASSLAVKDALYNSFVTLNLTPTVHEFELDDMGRVNFIINYLAYIEDYFDQQGFNIFAEAAITEKQIKRKLQVDNFTRNCDDDQLATLKKLHIDAVAAEKSLMLQNLIQSLMTDDNSKIYYLNMPYSEIQAFQSQGPLHTPSTSYSRPLTSSENDARLKTAVTEAMNTLDFREAAASSLPGSTFSAALFVDNPDNYSLGFFYVSDLIDTILHDIGKALEGLPGKIDELAKDKLGTVQIFDPCDLAIEKAKLLNQQIAFKKLRILLGPVEFVDQGSRSTAFFVNFGDIPISVKYFIEWLTERMLKKEETMYSLTKFLNDLFNHLVKEFLNNKSCFKVKINQKIRVNQSVVTSYPETEGEDEITYALGRASDNKENTDYKRCSLGWWNYGDTLGPPFNGSILNISGDRESPAPGAGVESEMNYFVYFAGRTKPTNLMTGDKEIDENNGIFHYLLGRDRGLIKDIKLTKTDSKGLAEVRYEQDGWGGLDQLRIQYDAEIECFASPKTFPGCYIYIDPKGFAPNWTADPNDPLNLTNFGIGGYYMIYRSEHLFGAGQASTRVFAKWVAELDPKQQEKGAEKPAQKKEGAKCTTYGDHRRSAAGEITAGATITKELATRPPDNVATAAPAPTPTAGSTRLAAGL